MTDCDYARPVLMWRSRIVLLELPGWDCPSYLKTEGNSVDESLPTTYPDVQKLHMELHQSLALVSSMATVLPGLPLQPGG